MGERAMKFKVKHTSWWRCNLWESNAFGYFGLSLSRLNHRLPWAQAHPEVMQGPAECHHQIADAFFPQAAAVFDDATTLDTPIDMLDPQPTLVQRLVRPLLLPRALLAAWLLGRPEDLHLREREGPETEIL